MTSQFVSLLSPLCDVMLSHLSSVCVTETADAARRLEDDRKRELFAELKEQMEKDLEVTDGCRQWSSILNILFMAPTMVYCKILPTLQQTFCRQNICSKVSQIIQ